MKNTVKTIALLLLITFTSCKDSVDYYNKSVSAGNSAITLFNMQMRIKSIDNGNEPEPENLVALIQTRMGYSEAELQKLKALIGNSEADPMVKSAIAYLEHDITSAKDEKTVQFLVAIDKKMTSEELDQIYAKYETHFNTWDQTKRELHDTYLKETSKYAIANGLSEDFYGKNQ